MTTPEPTPADDPHRSEDTAPEVPPANPAYSVPPPEGTGSADNS